MLHPIAANLAFSLGKGMDMGVATAVMIHRAPVQVGNPIPNVRLNGEFRCPGKYGAECQLPHVILGTTKGDPPLGSRALPDAPRWA